MPPEDKRLSMAEAIARYVEDGMSVAVEGFTAFICFAAGHEIIRQRRRDLTLIRMTPDLIYDQMIAAGVASKMIFSYLGNPGVGSLHAIRRAVEHGIPRPLALEEYTHYGLVGRYTAGASNLPFFPLRSYVGSDLLQANPQIKLIADPYGSGQIAVVPPLKPDLAILHAQRADVQGNTHLWGLLGVQKEVAFASKRVIVVVEEIVSEEVIRSDPNRTLIPGPDRGRGGARAVGRAPLLRAGLLRPRQRGLPGVGRAVPRPRAHRGVAGRVGLRCGEPHRVPGQTGRGAAGRAQARALARRARGLWGVPMSDTPYSAAEMMIVVAARLLAGVRTVFVGVGMPNIACNLARHTVAPALELIYESGVYGARPERLPLSIGDPTLVSGATSVVSIADLFGLYLQGGRIEVALLGGAQVDRFGNLNSTVIGEYDAPTVRLPGSGGACEIATNAQRTFIMMRLKRRAFVEQLDFVTTPGHLSGGDARRAHALPGAGPSLVITDRALFTFDNPEREMQLVELYPAVTVAEVQAAVGWPLRVAHTLQETAPPTPAELYLLRATLDPSGLYR